MRTGVKQARHTAELDSSSPADQQGGYNGNSEHHGQSEQSGHRGVRARRDMDGVAHGDRAQSHTSLSGAHRIESSNARGSWLFASKHITSSFTHRV